MIWPNTFVHIFYIVFFFGLESYRKCDGVGVSYGYILV